MIYDRPRSKFFNPFRRNNVQNLTREFHRPECKFPGSRGTKQREGMPRPIFLRDFKTKRLK